MGGLFNGIGGLLKPAEEPEVKEAEGPSAMDLAMQAAIEKHAAGKENEPRVTVARRASGGTFGRRGA